MIIPVVGERVLSRFGWGTIQEVHEEYLFVQLDQPFAGSERLSGRPEEFVTPMPFAVLRVLNIAGAGFYSFVAFLPVGLVDDCYEGVPKAQNEMRFLLNLRMATFRQSDPFGLLIEERYVLIASWADRWAATGVPPNVDFTTSELGPAVAQFRDRMHSTSGGIAYYIVFDTETNTIIWHEFLCETGWVAHPNDIRPSSAVLEDGARQLPESTE